MVNKELQRERFYSTYDLTQVGLWDEGTTLGLVCTLANLKILNKLVIQIPIFFPV